MCGLDHSGHLGYVGVQRSGLALKKMCPARGWGICTKRRSPNTAAKKTGIAPSLSEERGRHQKYDWVSPLRRTGLSKGSS